ncbi:MAG: thiamine pyrophosphate-dependent dehydrogenase E1 component subunit alpha [Planctomycetota bacterium]
MSAAQSPHPAVKHLEWMLRARLLENKLAALYRQGRIPGSVFMGKGQEALSAALGMHLRAGDVFAPLIRDMAGRLAFGEPLLDVVRVYLGRVTSPMRGRDGNVHRGEIARGILPMISHLGAMIAPCAGAMLARKLRGKLSGSDDPVACTVLGDGAMQTGAAHEGINLAAVERLPVVIVVAENQYAYSTPKAQSHACTGLVDRAIGYGLRGWSCDGSDPQDCWATVSAAFAQARNGDGPQLITASLLRLCGHGEHDDAAYIDPAVRACHRDCVDLAEEQVVASGERTSADLGQLRERIKAEIDAVVEQVLAEPEPTPQGETWQAYADPAIASEGPELP